VIAEYSSTDKLEIHENKFTLILLLEDEQEDKQEVQELYDNANLIKEKTNGELIIRYIYEQKTADEVIDLVYNNIESITGLEDH